MSQSRSTAASRSAAQGRTKATTTRLTAAVAAAGALSLIPVAAAPAAHAETASDFYAAPSPLPAAAPGTLIRSQSATLGGLNVPNTAWTVMYHSTDADEENIAVTGTVVVPAAAWTGSGARPFVNLAPGTQGLGPQCAPSKQFVAGTEYESVPVNAALAKGWGVVITDYEGYTTGDTHTYVNGPSMAHTVLDLSRAAAGVPGAGVTANTPWTIWGYSQGGGAAGWASALQEDYAPEMNLLGTAAGGIPATLHGVGEFLDGNVGAGFMLDALVGLAAAYPDQVPLDTMLNATGAAAVAQAKELCTVDTLAAFAFDELSDWTVDGDSFAELATDPEIDAVLDANDLAAAPAPTVPVLQYHTLTDEIVAYPQAAALQRAWCRAGVRTSFVPVAGGHATAEMAAIPMAITWLDRRFKGRALVNACVG